MKGKDRNNSLLFYYFFLSEGIRVEACEKGKQVKLNLQLYSMSTECIQQFQSIHHLLTKSSRSEHSHSSSLRGIKPHFDGSRKSVNPAGAPPHR